MLQRKATGNKYIEYSNLKDRNPLHVTSLPSGY
jgi:hypothetical protein